MFGFGILILGVYSVKNGYRSIVLWHEREASSVNSFSAWWKVLWKLKIQNKIKVFLWHASSNALPYKVNLFSKRVVSNMACIRCGSARESIFHAIWACPKVDNVWALLPCASFQCGDDRWGDFGAFCGQLSTLKKGEGLELFAMIAWFIWFDINEIVQGRKGHLGEVLIVAVMSYFKSFSMA